MRLYVQRFAKVHNGFRAVWSSMSRKPRHAAARSRWALSGPGRVVEREEEIELQGKSDYGDRGQDVADNVVDWLAVRGVA